MNVNRNRLRALPGDVLAGLAASGAVKVAGGVYDIATGQVSLV